RWWNMTQPLTLSSGPSFWRRRTAGGRAGILLLRAAIGLGVIIGLIEAIGGGSVTRVYAWTLAVMILGAGIIRAIACWRRGGAWECRIDEELMALTRSGEPPLVIDIGEIRQWIQRRSDGGGDLSAETAESHELKLRDGRIVRLDDYPF